MLLTGPFIGFVVNGARNCRRSRIYRSPRSLECSVLRTSPLLSQSKSPANESSFDNDFRGFFPYESCKTGPLHMHIGGERSVNFTVHDNPTDDSFVYAKKDTNGAHTSPGKSASSIYYSVQCAFPVTHNN